MFNTKHIEEHFGLLETNIPKCSDLKIKLALKAFVKQPKVYKKTFLQKAYNTVFDGYSYLGQTDSSNQYETDLLHSFVLSEFTKSTHFPEEFQSFLNTDWDILKAKIKALELEVVKTLNMPELERFYQANIGHMLSCNYYPELATSNNDSKYRLSKHTDVSLFTVFVFGITSGFGYSNSLKEEKILNNTHKVVLFPGYLLEYLSNGKYKALEHQVNFEVKNEDRFSFAFFSILKPSLQFTFNQKQFSSESYYQQYLSLF